MRLSICSQLLTVYSVQLTCFVIVPIIKIMYFSSCCCNSLKKVSVLCLEVILLIGQIGSFPTFEDEVVTEFRNLVKDWTNKDFMKSDGYLLRWLIGSNYDVDDAVVRFKKAIEWRKEHNIDHILQENFTSIDESYPYALDGFDKDGRPIAWAPIGTYDVRKIAIAGEQELYQRYMMRMFELIETYLHQVRRDGRENITQVVVIFDMGGFNVKQGACFRCVGMIPEFMSNVEQNYPNIFYKAYHINTPALFQNVFKIAQNFMSGQTKEALEIYDYNKDKWSAALLRQIPADQLPIQYGGTKPFDFHTSAASRNQLFADVLAKAHISVDSKTQEIPVKSGHTKKYEPVNAIQRDQDVALTQHAHMPQFEEVHPVQEATHDSISGASLIDAAHTDAPHLRHDKHNQRHNNNPHHHYQALQNESTTNPYRQEIRRRNSAQSILTTPPSLISLLITLNSVVIFLCLQ